MKHVFLILSLTFLFSFNASSQDEQINVEAVNKYKYIIVPIKYDFLSDADQYQMNSLTEFLFNKYGYTAFLENDSFPEDLRQDRCLALTVDVVKVKGGFLSTRLKINLMDCNNQLVVSSKMGKTREKEFKTAYNIALRGAFQSFQYYKYTYQPDPNIMASTSNNKTQSLQSNDKESEQAQDEIERLKQEVAALKEEKEVKQTEIILPTEAPTKEKTKAPTLDSKLVYAQPIKNGFQVIDQTPKVVMILLETPKANTFIVKDQNAIVYKEDGFWYLSKNDGNSLSLETLNIKF